MPVPLHLHIDAGAVTEVVRNAVQFNWPHGQKNLHFQHELAGLRSMWLDSVTRVVEGARNDTFQLVLEDDMRVSPHYFSWLQLMLSRYFGQTGCRDKDVMGISLSPVRVSELETPHVGFRPRFRSNVYLSTLPSSWGGGYFTDRWLEFVAFARVRMNPDYYDLEADRLGLVANLTPEALRVPGSASNQWPRSWKRFLVDFMYGRGLWMLYPSLPNRSGFATTLSPTKGSHTAKIMRIDMGDPSQTHPSDEDMQRDASVAPLVEDKWLLQRLVLPQYADMLTFDLFMRPVNRGEAAQQGAAFLTQVVASTPQYARLVERWQYPRTKLASNRLAG